MQKTNEMNIHDLQKICNGFGHKQITSMTIGDKDCELSFDVKYRLSMDEIEHVVNSVCAGVFDAQTGTYHPEWKDYCLRTAVLETYANISILDDADDAGCIDLIYGTPIFAMITGHDDRPVIFGRFEYNDNQVIDVEQYEQMLCSIDQKIEYAIKHEMVAELVCGIADSISDFMSADRIERGCEFHAP